MILSIFQLRRYLFPLQLFLQPAQSSVKRFIVFDGYIRHCLTPRYSLFKEHVMSSWTRAETDAPSTVPIYKHGEYFRFVKITA